MKHAGKKALGDLMVAVQGYKELINVKNKTNKHV